MHSVKLLTYNTSPSWLSFHWVDPAGQLNWLANELLDAEQSGDKVYILGHMAPGGSQTFGTWGRELARIVDRYFIIGNA